MDRNICRPVILYNNFVPPYRKNQEWEYEALGYYDGVSIGENIVCGQFELKQIWENSAEYAERLQGKYTAQVMYIFRHETGKEIITDQDFWKDRDADDTYPFLFLTMLRLNQSVESLIEIRHKLETGIREESVMLITYLSLDNNDLVVVIRSREYQKGIQIINQFHQKEISSIFYDGFSVGAINKKCLNSRQYQFADKDKIIEKVCLRIIEREPGSIQHLASELESKLGKNKLRRYPVLGCEDEVVIIETVTFGDFWDFYRDNSGLLSSSNKHYQQSVMGITALVLLDTDGSCDVLEDMREGNKIKIKGICDSLRKKCTEFYHCAQDFGSNGKMYVKAILQIINSLQKYENMEYLDYTYMALYKPMKMLIELIEEVRDNKDKCKYRNVFENISHFFNAVNLLTQNSVRLERQFIQSVELNARIYEAPVQISLFCTAYFSLLRDILNSYAGVQHKYEFMICPGMMENLNVQKLLPGLSRTRRLVLVEIPENQMYDIRKLLVMMAHEAAHFVGSDIRNRESRYDFMLQAIVKSVSTFLVLNRDMNQYCTEEIVAQFEEEYLDRLKQEVDAYCRDIENVSNGQRKKEDRYHAEYMDNDLLICAQSVLVGENSLLDEIGGKAFYNKYNVREQGYISPKNRVALRFAFNNDFVLNKLKFLNKLIVPSPTLSDEPCLSNVIDHNKHLFKEAFADLIAILLLDLKEKEYFETICDAIEESSKPFSTVMWRIALVIKVMCRQTSDNNLQWSEETFKKIEKGSVGEKEKFVLNKILEIISEYLSGENSIFEVYNKNKNIKYSYGYLDRMYNYDVGSIFCKYLGACCDMFQEKVRNNKYDQKKLSELRDIYRKLNYVNNIETYIYCIRSVIEKYRDNFVDVV